MALYPGRQFHGWPCHGCRWRRLGPVAFRSSVADRQKLVEAQRSTGRSEKQKVRLAEEITKAVTSALKSCEQSVSVGIEHVDPADWVEKVYRPDILRKPNTIYKKPGYDPV